MDSEIGRALRMVRERIARACDRAGRDPGAVQLVAVSKMQPAAAVRAAYVAGQRDFGESYVNELEQKASQCRDLADIRWHFIGHLQRNKAARAQAHAHLIHSIDTVRLVHALAAHTKTSGTRVLVQVSLAGEAQKAGALPEEVGPLLEAIDATSGRVVARGLMTMPPLFDDLEQARIIFRRLRELRDASGGPTRLAELSMGMSDDLEVAVEEGATLVRVGTAIFGERRSS